VQGDVILDVMPLDEKVLGFSNRWYRAAMVTAVTKELRRGLNVRVVTAPHFLATKIEAFRGRGKLDVAFSHDLEDLIFVIDGRATIVDEVAAESTSLRAYLGAQVAALLRMPEFLDVLPGYPRPDAASQARIQTVLQRLEDMASS
jgi:hypothetical protein